jgi:hypothetical protein
MQIKKTKKQQKEQKKWCKDSRKHGKQETLKIIDQL